MKNCIILLCFFLAATSCRKIKEQLAENAVLDAMTNGQWHVTKFTEGGTDITTDFTAYRFQFHSNNTVDAINNGVTEKTGSWSADANAQTITSSFPNAAHPLLLLNGTWKIINNSWTFVEARQTVNGEDLSLRLEK